VDLAGVVYQGEALLPGSVQALSRLKERVPLVAKVWCSSVGTGPTKKKTNR
jgi:hypothetical protein